MTNKIKKLLIAGSLVSGLFMAISACDIREFVQPSQNDNSSQIFFDSGADTSSSSYSSEAPISSSEAPISSSQEPEPAPVLLENITVSNNKSNYEYGEDLDITVIGHFSDGTDVEITNYALSGFNSEIPGEQTVSITYEGKSCSFKTTINNPVLVNITATANKESFEYGENLDVVVMGHYSDGSNVEITNYKVEGFDNQNPGEQTLTFSFENKECTLRVAVKERKNLFPTEKMSSFLKLEGVEATIPSPIGFDEWEDSVESAQDGSKYFFATTNDEGQPDVDTIADQYAVLLESNSWSVTKDNKGYIAVNNEDGVSLTFSTKNKVFSLRIESYSEFPNKKYIGSLIRNKINLQDGDTIVLGSISKEYVVSGFDKEHLNVLPCDTTDTGLDYVSKDAWRFKVNKVGTNYTFTDIHGRKLGATGSGQLAWDEGSTEWSLTLTTRSSIILNANSAYGRLCYDAAKESISTYENVSNSNLSYPQIFGISEIDVVYPTSISLNGKEAINAGKTSQLSVNYFPENSNALNEVEWFSSNEAVATVDNGVVKGISVGKVTITARTKSKNNYIETSFNLDINEAQLDSWTIMVYMCGADLESDNGLASADIAEMLGVSNQPDDVNIIIETGGSSKWKRYGIDANVLSRYHIKNKALVLDETLPKDNMGKQSVFESFLNWGLQEYPAYKTGVILWNHGGALDGVCFDDTTSYSDSLLNSETSKAFKNVFDAHGIKKLEFVGYDACLMQVQDIADFNSHYFKYMVGSEELENGYGWVYDSWIDDMYADKDTATILKAGVDGFINENGGDQTLSYLDLSKFDNYKARFEEMASVIKSTAKNNYSAFKSLIKKVKDYGDYTEYWYSQNGLDAYGTIDGMDFLNKLGNDTKFSAFKAEIDAAKDAYQEVVGYSKCGSKAGASNGMSIIAPLSIAYSTSETSFTNWRSIFK